MSSLAYSPMRRAGLAKRSPGGIASAPFWVETLLEGPAEGDLTAMRATLDPGTRTNWHSHPRGQFLYVLSGCGQIQREALAIETVRAGDAVWFGPDEVHWHGAAPDSPFSYVSVQPRHGGETAAWFNPVAD